MNVIQNVVNFILVIGVLVFFHELGHFLFAKLFKMKVEEFALGFGRRLIRVGYDGETEYTIRMLPLGGFVRIKGMEIEDAVERRLTGASEDEPQRHDDSFETTNYALSQQETTEVSGVDPDGFNNRPIWQRFFVIFGGPLFSFILGWIVLCLVGVMFGLPTGKVEPSIGQAVSGEPAYRAGLRTGDSFTAIDGKKVNTWQQVLDGIRSAPGRKITITVRNPAGTERTVSLVPKSIKDPETGKQIGQIGIAPKLEIQRVSLAESFRAGNELVGVWFGMIGKLFASGAIKDSVGGPITIFRETQGASNQGGSAVMLLLGQLSLSLGLFNLFPIPFLDGGHLALMALEGIRRRKLTAMQTEWVFRAGFVLLLAIFVAVMFKDISRIFNRG